jgi:hypothetical protein
MHKQMWASALLVLGMGLSGLVRAQDLNAGELGGMSVDYLRLKPEFGRNIGARNLTRNQLLEWDYDDDYSGRVNLNLFLSEQLSVRGSYFEFSGTSTFQLLQLDPNQTIVSEPVVGDLFISAPQPYAFLNQLPTRAQANTTNPNNLTLPPFPFPTAASAGFRDSMFFYNQYQFSSGSLELSWTPDMDSLNLRAGVGGQFASYSQKFRARRFNSLGQRLTLNFDPFNLAIPDAVTQFLQDQSSLDYDYSFEGGGPRFSFEVSFPRDAVIQIFASARGALLLGSRDESATRRIQQRIRIFDQSGDAGLGLPTEFFAGTDDIARANRSQFAGIPMGELELGAQMQFPGDFRAVPFIRATVLGQWWSGLGNSTDPNANFELIGFALTGGVSF